MSSDLDIKIAVLEANLVSLKEQTTSHIEGLRSQAKSHACDTQDSFKNMLCKMEEGYHAMNVKIENIATNMNTKTEEFNAIINRGKGAYAVSMLIAGTVGGGIIAFLGKLGLWVATK